MKEKYLIVIIGPTAIGKTTLAIDVATHYNTEIISADSRQFFKEMAIGTAVPSSDELLKVKHHFIQHKSIKDSYSVGDFERDAIAKLDSLFKHQDIVVMVGGSGLYVDAVLNGLDSFPTVPADIRNQLNERFRNEGLPVLQHMLKRLDPEYYLRVDVANPHRLIRALEICVGTGRSYSSFLSQPKIRRNFVSHSIGLQADRDIIYTRINQRVDEMMRCGLLLEAEKLLPYKKFNALQTVGYKELFGYFEGKYPLEVAVEEIKKNTRRFAKRQITWFKKTPQTHWFAYNDSSTKILSEINTKIQST
ncbi:tRNA (adenosine(37)-N6)-dimethylallyltransferase MiaA [Arenibacter sp. GZD96]|uniref:tRNA (adenosine(37)-N6)-dimethylallyltransferase MiaA n=1 Tax=Aurantibrevibacter litoralis TaxID=3106030 RepID=UPI002AFE210E|nr:tRNA (adenosine(37)-N6)-dimethylallyltransferase MiaA [Arenibacter sp. GZD-96]MEA1786357.1 tRNA (adenosine(37)-N6)-dimethylallyltransferase MiaA [Arenibacter sp. GZD-96]